MIKRPLLLWACALIAGICSWRYFHLSLWMLILLFGVIPGLSVLLIRRRFTKAMLLWLCAFLFLCAGNLGMHGYDNEFEALEQFYNRQTLYVTGEVEGFEPRENTVYCYLRKVTVKSGKAPFKSYAVSRFLLYVDESVLDTVRIGNTVCCRCSFYPFRTARNNGNFDEPEYYYSCGVSGKGSAENLTVLDPSYLWLKQTLFRCKRQMIDSMTLMAGAGEAAVFAALVTGDRSGLSEETKTLYSDSGIAHILAISGLHVSILGMALFRLLRKYLHFTPAAVLSSAFMVLFLLFSGMQVSAVRATIMFIMFLIAKGFGKSYDPYNALCISALVLLFTGPYYLFHAGFRLSFTAILAASASSRLSRTFFKVKPGFLRSFINSFSISLATMPLLADMYFQIPLYAVLLNLAVLPCMSFLLGSGAAAGAAGLFSIAFGRFLLGSGMFIITFINGISDISRRLPFSILPTGNPGTFKILLFYGVLLLLYALSRYCFLLRLKKKHARRNNPVRILALLFFFVPLILLVPEKHDLLHISLIDADQGECILLQNDNGRVYLIDCGSTGVDQVFRYRVESALKYYGIQTIDYLFLTHPDADHMNGIEELFADDRPGKLKVKHVYCPRVEGSDSVEKLRLLAIENKAEFHYISSGYGFHDGALHIKCLHPDTSFRSNDTNAYSAVLKVDYYGFSALFMGDLEADGEKKLLERGLLSDCDLLKAGHHGSENASSEAFLNTVRPETVLISAGVSNSYGHPHKEAVKRLSAYAERIFCTSSQGQIDLFINKKKEILIRTKLKGSH